MKNVEHSGTIRIANRKENPYTVVDNAMLNNPNMSFEAKGLLAWLLARPDNWQIIIGDLTHRFKAHGRDSIRSIVNELIKHGYIEKVKLRDERGRLNGVEYLIYEKPKSDLPARAIRAAAGSSQSAIL